MEFGHSTSAPPGPDEHDLGEVVHHLDDVMSGARQPPDPVDVRHYLLDPPPTPEQAQRLERRRRLVRGGSVGAAALLAVVLLVPWPGGGDGAPAEPAQTDPAGFASSTNPAAVPVEPTATPALPRRLDAPAGQSRSRRALHPARRARRMSERRASGAGPRRFRIRASALVPAVRQQGSVAARQPAPVAPTRPAPVPTSAPSPAPPVRASAPSPAPAPRPSPPPTATSSNAGELVPVM